MTFMALVPLSCSLCPTGRSPPVCLSSILALGSWGDTWAFYVRKEGQTTGVGPEEP